MIVKLTVKLEGTLVSCIKACEENVYLHIFYFGHPENARKKESKVLLPNSQWEELSSIGFKPNCVSTQ